MRDQLTRHERDTVAQPDYSAEEAEYDAWQNTRRTLEENVQHAKESYNDASYTREVTLRQKLRIPLPNSTNWISDRHRNRLKGFRQSDSKKEKSRLKMTELFQGFRLKSAAGHQTRRRFF